MWWSVAGLTLDLLGAVALGIILQQHSVNVIASSGPTSVPKEPVGVLALRLGWSLVALGFALQIVGEFCG